MKLTISCGNVHKIEILDSFLVCYSHNGVEKHSLMGITEFSCSLNRLTTLPELPESIVKLSCHGNELQNLPTLPKSLKILKCENNYLRYLPELPETLEVLVCYGNQLVTLKKLPKSLHSLGCGSNPLIFIAPLPIRPKNYAKPEELRNLHSEENYDNYRKQYHTYKFLIAFLALDCQVLPTILSTELFLFWK